MQILDLTLACRNLVTQKNFYANTLSMRILDESIDSFVLSAGSTRIKFISDKRSTPYHFAFNIPSRMEFQALKWLQDRIDVLTYLDKPIVDFPRWYAKAIYFLDPEENIVEFIARRNLKIKTRPTFDETCLLNVSEIGTPVEDIKMAYAFLKDTCGIEIFDGTFEKFCAAGDDQGLFIIIDKRKKKWFMTDEYAHSSEYRIILKSHSGICQLAFEKGQFSVVNNQKYHQP